MAPIPYAHLQLARATRKPNAKGERNGEIMNPMVHTLSCNHSNHCHGPGGITKTHHTSLAMEGVHVCHNVKSLYAEVITIERWDVDDH